VEAAINSAQICTSLISFEISVILKLNVWEAQSKVTAYAYLAKNLLL